MLSDVKLNYLYQYLRDKIERTVVDWSCVKDSVPYRCTYMCDV